MPRKILTDHYHLANPVKNKRDLSSIGHPLQFCLCNLRLISEAFHRRCSSLRLEYSMRRRTLSHQRQLQVCNLRWYLSLLLLRQSLLRPHHRLRCTFPHSGCSTRHRYPRRQSPMPLRLRLRPSQLRFPYPLRCTFPHSGCSTRHRYPQRQLPMSPPLLPLASRYFPSCSTCPRGHQHCQQPTLFRPLRVSPPRRFHPLSHSCPPSSPPQ